MKYEQKNHSIEFEPQDVLEVGKITPYNVSSIVISECDDVRCSHKKVKEICAQCSYPHKQRVFMDGWEVKLDVDKYYVKLRTGIRVPVDKETYDLVVRGL